MNGPKIDWESVDRFFPSPGALGGLVPASGGLSVRDAVALIALYAIAQDDGSDEFSAKMAWRIADLWMAEREKRRNEAKS